MEGLCLCIYFYLFGLVAKKSRISVKWMRHTRHTSITELWNHRATPHSPLSFEVLKPCYHHSLVLQDGIREPEGNQHKQLKNCWWQQHFGPPHCKERTLTPFLSIHLQTTANIFPTYTHIQMIFKILQWKQVQICF